MLRVLLCVCLAVCVACLQPSLVECPEGVLCPNGYVCDPAHRTCLLPEQLENCRGMTDDASCLVGGSVGYCRDEICLPISCGNGIVDLTEVCDDGNLVRGDGCNTTCSSDEICGNGIIDPGVGEECDDANHIDGDRCDSRCRTETETWTIRGVGLANDGVNKLVYDEARQQMMFVTEGTTWRYDGTAWSLVTTEGLPHAGWSLEQVVYDPDRQRVVLVGRTATSDLFAYEWDGTAWTQIALQSPPALTFIRITYDPVRDDILVVGNTSTGGGVRSFLLDAATGTMSEQAPVTNLVLGNAGLAWDASRNVAVLVDSNNVFEWNGNAWARTIATTSVVSNHQILFDRRENAIISIGGQDTFGDAVSTVMKWSGTLWTVLPAQALPVPRYAVSLAWDPVRERRIVFGGVEETIQLNDTFEWNGTSWSRVGADTAHHQASFGTLSFAYDPRRAELVQLGGIATNGNMDAWALGTTGWRQLPPAPFTGGFPAPFGYDPIRGGFVYSTVDGGTFQLVDDQWSTIEPEGTSALYGATAMTFDPTRRAIIALAGMDAWALGSAEQVWRALPVAPATSPVATMAFDARRQAVIAGIGDSVYSLGSAQWSELLSPGPFFKALEDPRRGTVVFFRAGSSMWELVDNVWLESPNPIFGQSAVVAYSPIDGTFLALVTMRAARLLFERRFVGPTPRDACTGGDEDGDGLLDCADDDCWWSCTPACPPLASCP